MGCGKSTVGRQLAERTGSEFHDLDDRIEQVAGVPISALIEGQGEGHFRSLEGAQLSQILDEAQQGRGQLVVALGGGALLDEPLRTRALDETFVVTLTATVDTLTARTSAAQRDGPGSPPHRERPLLDDANRRGAVTHLLKQRAPAYGQAHTSVCTDHRSPKEVVEVLLARWQGGRLCPGSTGQTS